MSCDSVHSSTLNSYILSAELQEAFTMNCSADNTIPINKLGTVIRSIGRAPTEANLQALIKEFESKGQQKSASVKEHSCLFRSVFLNVFCCEHTFVHICISSKTKLSIF